MKYERWSFDATHAQTGILLPDGCRDIVLRTDASGAMIPRVTSLDFAPRAMRWSAGSSLQGYRLRPGTDVTGLLAHLPELDIADLDAALPADTEICDIVAACASARMTPARIARRAGASLRTVQRHLRHAGQPPLRFWQQLGRARLTASRLAQTCDLADLACAGGYADQAHMTRAFARWFGVTPARLVRRADLMVQVAQPGAGTWTGEQISTR